MRAELPKPPEIYEAVEAALKKPRSLDYLTFSGNGEPTIHPDFPEIVRGVKAIKDKLRPDAKLAILSNSSRVSDPEVAAALRLFDAPIMKLDAGDEETFEKINHPVGGLTIDDVVGGLKRLPLLIIQSVLINGDVTNIRGEAFEHWANRLAELHPRMVQIYSTERPTADANLQCVSPEKLQAIAKTLQEKYQLRVEAYWRR
jgi:wyosine [tRNA(Phe)-imidazoG37] synthetase (radical SAM superfamily)